MQVSRIKLEDVKDTVKVDLLYAVEQITELLKSGGCTPVFKVSAAHYIKYLSKRLKLTDDQCILLAAFLSNSDDSSINMRDISSCLQFNAVRMIRYADDIDELRRRGFITSKHSYDDIRYRVPRAVIEAFRKDECFVPKDISNLSCMEFFCELSEIFEDVDDNGHDAADIKEKIMNLINSNGQLLFVKRLRLYELNNNDIALLVLFCHLFVNKGDDDINFYSDLTVLYDDKTVSMFEKSLLMDGSHALQEHKLIEFNNNDGLVDRESYRLTMKTKKYLLSELNLPLLEPSCDGAVVIKCNKIVEKQLFYDKKIKPNIDELGSLLDETHYRQIRGRLMEKGFRCGFTCLFYGAPGTGKTETVLQLARRTGRDIIQVNLSQIKSKWVGDSEKNIKEIFDDYRSKVGEDTKTPILLFNEADAIIGKRKEGADKAVDKMENTIQNIILQEMETLDGILIATTNLAGNMDSAFERRFLYKIKFEKPTVDARMNIWHSMLSALPQKDIRFLAQRYEFSGGQIENIARHYAIDYILHGDSAQNLESLIKHCDNERLDAKNANRIGF